MTLEALMDDAMATAQKALTDLTAIERAFLDRHREEPRRFLMALILREIVSATLDRMLVANRAAVGADVAGFAKEMANTVVARSIILAQNIDEDPS